MKDEQPSLQALLPVLMTEARRRLGTMILVFAAIALGALALAWMLGKPFVTAPIIGASKPGHLDDAIAALSLQLSSEEIGALEEHYVPHAVAGH